MKHEKNHIVRIYPHTALPGSSMSGISNTENYNACDTEDEKRGLKNGDNSELGDDGIIFSHCISGWLVTIWFTGCSNTRSDCDGRNGHYQI
jgi:hypothetical protein